MKAYTRVLYLVAALLLAAIAVFALLTQSYRSHGTDPLLLNDMLQTVKEHWEDMDSLDTGQFAGEMLIFNSEDFIVYSTAQKELTGIGSVQEAIHRGCLCLAVSEDSRFLGTVVIPDPDKTDRAAVPPCGAGLRGVCASDDHRSVPEDGAVCRKRCRR